MTSKKEEIVTGQATEGEGTQKKKKSEKPKQRMQYSQTALKKAIEEVKSGTKSLSRVSTEFSIPKSTLHSKITEKVPETTTPGRQSYLTPAEEEKLEKWIIGKAELGFPMHPEEVKDVVQKFLEDNPRDNPFTNNRPGNKWMKLFLKRHPLISKRRTESISKARASVTEEGLREWFAEVEEYFAKNDWTDVLQDPRRVFNGDETGIQLSPKSSLLLGAKDQKNFYEIAAGHEKENMTVLFTFNAAGDPVPPMIMYPYIRKPPKHIIESVPSDFIIGRSDSGWVVSGSFYEYVANHFYPWLMANKVPLPVVLFIDGARPHMDMALTDFCIEKKIILYCLPPNATHILQPCDVSVFKGLKSHWRSAVHEHKQKTQTSITRTNFAPTLKIAFDKFLENKEVVANGFRRCGLYPFDADAPDYTRCISRRRKDLFKETEVDEPIISTAEFTSAKKVIEEVIGETNVELLSKMKGANDSSQDAIFLLWKVCSDGAAGSVSPRDLSILKTVVTEDLESSTLETTNLNTSENVIDHGQGIFSIPLNESLDLGNLQESDDINNNNIDKTRSPQTSLHTSTSESNVKIIHMDIEEDITLEELQNLENYIEETPDETTELNQETESAEIYKKTDSTLTNNSPSEKNAELRGIVDKNMNQSEETPTPVFNVDYERVFNLNTGTTADIGSQAVLSNKKEVKDPWEEHLHWPQPPAHSVKKCAKKKIPFALTGEEWRKQMQIKQEAEAEKKREIAERKELRRIQQEAREKEVAERARLRQEKKEAAAAAKAEKDKIKTLKAQLAKENNQGKPKKAKKLSNKKTSAAAKTVTTAPGSPESEQPVNEDGENVDKDVRSPQKRNIENKRRSTEPLPKVTKEE